MTTIATDGMTMAADGRVTEGSEITQSGYTKIHRLSDGRIVGFTGNAFNDGVFLKWLADGEKGDLPAGLDNEFCCIVLTPGGEVSTYDEHGRKFIEQPPYAVGSGRKWARAAMELGKTPKQAVEFACRFDCYSGGEIKVLSRNIREAA